jgi:hypothetical protein
VRRGIVAIALVAAVTGTAFYSLRAAPMDDPSKSPPRQLQISLGQTVRDFMQINHLLAESGHVDTPDKNNYGVALDVIADTDPIVFGDHWIAPVVTIGKQRFDLPPGRTLFIDQEAGRIKSFSFTPHAQARPLQETNRLVKPMLDWFLTTGWRPEVANSLTFALTDDDVDFKRSGEKIYAQLEDGEHNLVEVTVSDLARLPSQPAYLLAPAPVRPVHVPPVYVIRLGFYWAHRNDLSYGDLIFPRRLFVNGNKDRFLRLRPWVEDPEWTPERHGMTDLGGTGESRRWSLPGK